jgi:2-methylisocitrate lyase-like PEP mutase family enzyme
LDNRLRQSEIPREFDDTDGGEMDMRTQAEKAQAFRALHDQPGAFIIPNPWEVGTAKLLAGMGFEALATTSSGLAKMLGRADGRVSRAEVIENCRMIADATDLPVNADLENCFAHEPEAAAEAIRLAGEAGVVGASIEDFTGDPKQPIYDFDLSVARVRAAVKVARAHPVPILLTARAENLIHGRMDRADTIRRLQAYEAAGADVVYAPGLRNIPEVREVVRAVKVPVNVVTGWLDPDITLSQLSEAGAKRISLGGALARHVLATFVKAGRAMQEHGSFAWMREMIGMAEVRKLLET